jgi:hypothetical protein
MMPSISSNMERRTAMAISDVRFSPFMINAVIWATSPRAAADIRPVYPKISPDEGGTWAYPEKLQPIARSEMIIPQIIRCPGFMPFPFYNGVTRSFPAVLH